MAGLIQDLIGSLQDQLICYEQLLDLSDEKTKVIIANQVDSLQAVTKREQELAGKLPRLERKREQICSDIALVLNQDPEGLTLQTIIELLKEAPEEQSQLVKLKQDITDVIEQLKLSNEKNKKLIHQALDYIEFTMNAIQSGNQAASIPGYEQQGRTTQQQGRSFFDRKQ